jgi:hypothetical protein
MKSLLSALIVFTFSCSAMAQNDSVKTTLQKRQLYFADSVSVAGYQFGKRSPLLISDLMPKQSSIIGLGYQFDRGNLIEAQGSTMTNQLSLRSEGTTEIRGINLFGSFSYQKVFEDSTRFAHQTRNNQTTPYYFGSPAYNHYERSVYDFNLLAAKKLVNGKLTGGLGLNYHIADHFSDNDPRGSIKEYRLNSQLALGYRVTRHLNLGIAYQLGYGQEKFNIGYKNRTYYESLVYPRYVNYIINGYGEPQPRVSRRNYNNFLNSGGPQLSINITNTNFGAFYLLTSLNKETQVYDYRTGEEITELANYELVKTEFNLLWINQNLLSGKVSAQFTYQSNQGEDFNLNFLAKNYLFNGRNLGIATNYITDGKKTKFNYAIGVKNYSEERIDGITGNNVYFSNLLLKASFGFNHLFSKNRSFGGGIGITNNFNLADRLSISPANESFFTREVILHNYLYHTATTYMVETSVNYSFPFFNAMQSAITLRSNYQISTNLKSLQRTLSSVPGNDRFLGEISFNLYF